MLEITDNFAVLNVIDATEKMGLDVMSGCVALAWATEAFDKAIISEEQTIVPLKFGDAENYEQAIFYLGKGVNDFYRLLGQGTLKAAAQYGGEEFACVLGQEMAGYATGEVYFASQALGLRHSHLDTGGYAYDQKYDAKKEPVDEIIDFLVQDEQDRVFLNSMVACLFARGVYSSELLSNCLRTVGYTTLADSIPSVSRHIQELRWHARMASGYDPSTVKIPKRFHEVTTRRGPVDSGVMNSVKDEYQKAIIELAQQGAESVKTEGQ
jgi:aldehyde:ferredoxin oxidoreductase